MTALLVIIYISFISLGLPDSLLGSAWPAMYQGFGVSIANAGIASMIIAGGTIISSFFSDALIRRLGTGLVTLLSVAMTAFALLGISFSTTFPALCLCAIPLGLGAGSVDAALNNFVALHYQAAHMNWLHCFWGIGASIGPAILSAFLARSGSWNAGYRVISVLQFLLVAALLFSMRLWKRAGAQPGTAVQGDRPAFGLRQLIKLPRAKPTLAAFFCYCSLEATVGLWGSSYLVVVRNVAKESAARWISLFFLGITLGRAVSGFLSLRLIQRRLIRLGQALIGVGLACILLPLTGTVAAAGLFLIGLGCAPIYPSLLHETPNTFGAENSQAIMGIQMASAYVGSTFMPPVFGLLGGVVGYWLFPLFLIFFLVIMIFMVGGIYRECRDGSEACAD